MFDKSIDGVAEADTGRAALAIDNMAEESREENAAGARRLTAIGTLYEVQAPDDDVAKVNWAIDGHTSLVAEVATALAISRCRAAAQVKMAINLYTRLPRVLKVATTGLLDYRILSRIATRTELIIDDEVMARVDEQLAQKAPRWVRLSDPKTEARVNAVIGAADPLAVIHREEMRRDRYVDAHPTEAGMVEMSAQLDAAAAAAVIGVLDELADGVCPDDPRTKQQRRADSMWALACGQTLECLCGQPDCPVEPAAIGSNAPRAQVIVHVVADAAHTQGIVAGHGHIGGPAVQDAAARATVRAGPRPRPTRPRTGTGRRPNWPNTCAAGI